MVENKVLMVLAVVAVGVALANAVVTYNKVSDISGAVVDTGYANLSIESFANINFTTDTIDWGSGVVDTGQTEAYLDTKAGTVTNGNWTTNSDGLVLENIGNVNVSLVMAAGKTAADFVGGTNPDYDWLFEEIGSGSCVNSSTIGTFQDTNSSFTVCDVFAYEDAKDDLKIHINLTVPYNSKTGAQSDTITATATAVS